MAVRFQKLKWELHQKKYKMLLIYGLKRGLISHYDDELIKKLRNVYYGGIPASIILLSNGMSNGYCYDRALLLAQVFLDDDSDVNLLYGDVDSLKLNPILISDDSCYADHCFVERITKNGKHLIYDTSSGFIFDKKIYWLMENPKLRYINNKESIRRFIEEDIDRCPEDLKRDKYTAPLILSLIEATFKRFTKMYCLKEIELFQREIKLFKEEIKYDGIDGDIQRLSLKK